MPDISISGIAQTADGYLWVATKGGLSCFNGQQFFTLPTDDFPLMPSHAVRALFRDHHGWLWLKMERGPLLCLKPDGLQRFTAKGGLPDGRVLTMVDDREDAVWVVYPTQMKRILNGRIETIDLPDDWRGRDDVAVARNRTGEIWCAKENRLGVWRDGGWQAQVRLKSVITALGAAGASNLWVAAGGNLFQFQEGKPPVKMGVLPPSAVADALMEDRSGALWIGTVSDGLFRWEAGRLQSVPTSQQEITALFEDREGNVLVGTAGGGLNLIRAQAVALLRPESGFPFESVLSVAEDADGGLWAVSQNGQLARGVDGDWNLVSGGTNWPGGKATCVTADAKGGVWVGTSDHGLMAFQNGHWRECLLQPDLCREGIRSLLAGSNGDVWMATRANNRLRRLRDGQVQTVTNMARLGPIRALVEDARGAIWIGTSEGEVRRVQDMTLVAEPAVAESKPLSVRSLLVTADGSLWIGYAGDGLGHLKDGHYQRLTSEAGLPDDFVSQLLDDGSGHLWIAGNRGLSRVSFAELDSVMAGRLLRMSARRYGSADGLPGLQPSRDCWPTALRAGDGRLWLAMRNGLLAVQPDRISDNPLPPVVQLERVLVDDRPVALYNAGSPLQTQSGTNLMNLRGAAKKLALDPGHRKLEIDFAGLSFSSPENVQFRYRLNGFDSKWVEVGVGHGAIYPRLPAGNYEFQVFARNNNGVWNDRGASLAMAVKPFFWDTLWFKVGGGLVCLLLAGGFAFTISRRRYREKIRRLESRRALEQERTRIARDIHDDLGASLTRISLLSQSSGGAPENREDAATLSQIHQTARDLTHAMGEVVWAVNPEHDTFDSLANYISNYGQSFLSAAQIRCRLEMPVQLPRLALSSGIRHNLLLAFKEALNNAAKHAGASEVRIALTADDSVLELVVADNGKGLAPNSSPGSEPQPPPPRAAPGNGLANMRGRLREIGGDCDLKSEPGGGTKITFRVNLKKNHARP